MRLAQTTGLSLGLQKSDNVVLTNRADNVANDGTLGFEELSAHLGDTTTGARATEAL